MAEQEQWQVRRPSAAASASGQVTTCRAWECHVSTTWPVQCYESERQTRKRSLYQGPFIRHPAVCSTACVAEMITATSEVGHLPSEKFTEEWSCKTEVLSETEHTEKSGSGTGKGTVYGQFLSFFEDFECSDRYMVSRPGHRTAICTTRYHPFVPQLVQFLIITRISSVVILIFRYFMWLVYMSFALTNKPFWPTVKYQTVFSPLKFSRLLLRAYAIFYAKPPRTRHTYVLF